MIIQIGTEVDESRILWKHKESDEWERADIDDLIEAYENRQKEPKPGDSISRQALIDEILEDGNGAVLSYPTGMYEDDLVERIEKQMIDYFVEVIKYASPVEPKIYGNEHNCIMTLFGECSYSETGCGDCAVVEKVRDALKGECPPVGLKQSELHIDESRGYTLKTDKAEVYSSKRPKRTETMMIDGEPTEIAPLSYEVGYTHGQSEQPKGKWIENDDFTCSECGYHMIVGGGAYNFCPNCGCQMERADIRGGKDV